MTISKGTLNMGANENENYWWDFLLVGSYLQNVEICFRFQKKDDGCVFICIFPWVIISNQWS